jgi:hypothetical protein
MCISISTMILPHNKFFCDSTTLHFQKKKSNYSTAKTLANAILMELQSLRSDNSFKLIWAETEEITVKENIALPKIPRKKTISTRLGGGEAFIIGNDISSYFKINIYFCALDIMINDIKTRFLENNLRTLNALHSCLSTRNYNIEDILEVCNTYNIEKDYLKVELKLFSKMCSSNNINENFEEHLNFFLTKELFGTFENIYNIFKIYLSIPISSASSERSFSSLRRFKTFTRSTIGQERLCNLALLHIERIFKISFDKIITHFDADCTQRRRRLQLS